AERSADVHRKFESVLVVESRMLRRAGLVLASLLAGVAVAGAALAADGDLGVDRLVTLFLVTAMFVGQVDNLVHHLPDIQEGLGALTRIRQMLAVEPEPTGGRSLPSGPVGIELRDLHFSYAEGTFALDGVTLRVPAGQTVALVGRTGSGKSTLASLLSRAVEPPRGAVLVGGVDVRDLDLQALRAAVGVVTQRTEILAGTLAENIALFADVPRADVEAAVRELRLDDWAAGLPDGLDTLLGPGGTSLSAGEEQLVAFARLLVRDVQVVVLDEATARMDPLTEARVVAASERLLAGRTGVLVAHRLSTIERAGLLAVLDHGRVVQQGERAALARVPGPYRDLLAASAAQDDAAPAASDGPTDATAGLVDGARPTEGSDAAGGGSRVADADGSRTDRATDAVGGRRRRGTPPVLADPGDGPSLARGVVHALFVRPAWGVVGALLFLVALLVSAQGAITGFLWGRAVQDLDEGFPAQLLVPLAVLLVVAPLCLAWALYVYPRWWIEVLLRVRMAVMAGQTRQHRLTATPPGEVVARA